MFEATHAALDQFDAVDNPAVDALRTRPGKSVNLAGFNDARKAAADRVRAAFLADTSELHSEENVELMSVERIRAFVKGTLLGRMMRLLP